MLNKPYSVMLVCNILVGFYKCILEVESVTSPVTFLNYPQRNSLLDSSYLILFLPRFRPC